MPHTPEAIVKELKAGKYAPIYFLQGDEPYYIDLISDYVEKHCVQPHERSFNQTILYGKDAKISDVLSHARRFPMMAERQVVIVKEAQEIADLGKENGDKMLEAYLSHPLPSTVLVFCHKNKTLDGRKALAKSIDKKAILVTTSKIRDYQLGDWIQKYCGEHQIKITPKAVTLLADHIGNDLQRISNEVSKILINLKDKKEINEDLVEKYVGISKEFNIFELQKALVAKDQYKVHQIVHYFAANPKDNPIQPNLAALFSFFMKVLLVHGSVDKSEGNLARVLQLPPFIIKEYLSAAKVFPLHKTKNILHYLHEADLKSKGIDSGSLKDGELLKDLAFKITH